MFDSLTPFERLYSVNESATGAQASAPAPFSNHQRMKPSSETTALMTRPGRDLVRR